MTLLLIFFKFYRPGGHAGHKLLGRLAMLSVLGGTFFAMWMAYEHIEIPEYGGILSTFAFLEM